MPCECELRCAKCRKRVDEHHLLLYGLCESCLDRLRDKLDEVRDISYAVQDEMKEKYNTRNIEEAWVIKKWGRPYEKLTYTCDRCGCMLKESIAKKNGKKKLGIFNTDYVYYCDSCKKRNQREEEERTKKYNREERKRFNRL